MPGIFAAAGSTLLIVLFGEIIPQAACSRYGLAVGSYTRHFTKVVMGLTFVVSFPLSKLLDYFLGKEIAVKYSRDKVKELLWRNSAKDKKEQKQFKLISGALDFNKKSVGEIMKPIKEVFSLDINAVLDFDTFKTILYHGYSRIPVHEHTKENFVGMILIQDLLLNDPADRVPLKAVMDYYKHPVLRCKLSDGLEGMLEKLRKGASHMAFVYNDDVKFYDEEDQTKDSSSQYLQSSSCLDAIHEAVGILTLENIIEALVDEEIMDEADTKRERRKKRK
jgi:metal transporter CNNM